MTSGKHASKSVFPGSPQRHVGHVIGMFANGAGQHPSPPRFSVPLLSWSFFKHVFISGRASVAQKGIDHQGVCTNPEPQAQGSKACLHDHVCKGCFQEGASCKGRGLHLIFVKFKIVVGFWPSTCAGRSPCSHPEMALKGVAGMRFRLIPWSALAICGWEGAAATVLCAVAQCRTLLTVTTSFWKAQKCQGCWHGLTSKRALWHGRANPKTSSAKPLDQTRLLGQISA